MSSIPVVEHLSPIEPSSKVVPLAKQRTAEVRCPVSSKSAFLSVSDLSAVEPQTVRIVHDMQSPLSVILNVLNAYQKIPLSQLDQTRLILALEETERLKRMMNEILTCVRPSREPVIALQEIQLGNLIQDVIQLSKTSTIAADRQIIVVPNAVEGTVKGDRDKLKQLFLNLLTNACEAVERGDTITIRVQVDICTNQVMIQICNGGHPIPSHLMSTLGYQPITTKDGGHGLGLMIVREIIDAHGGTLKIQSKHGQGTTICVQLPLAKHIDNPLLNTPLPAAPATHTDVLPNLSTRETEVLQLLVEGYSNPEIAQTLFISMNTVKTHVCNLMNKLGVKGRTQIAVKALRTGLAR